MAKKKKQSAKPAATATRSASGVPGRPQGFKSVRTIYILLALLSLALYANTLGHGYVLDDASTITENHFVKGGWEGFKNILTSEYRAGYWVSDGNLYRPLSLLMFNLEWSIAPDQPFLPHLINVLLYALTCIILYRFLLRLPVKDAPVIALITTLIFIAHPIHTEVVANIKSRDEILSLLFGLLFLFYWAIPGSSSFSRPKIFALVALLFALFSKESALIFIPIAMLYSFLLERRPVITVVRNIWPAFIPAMIYMAARMAVVGGSGGGTLSRVDNALVHVMGTPEYFSSAFAYLLQYFRLLVFPHPLACDYGFAQIPLTGFGDIATWLGILIPLMLGGLFVLWRNHLPAVAFGIGFLLMALALPSNLFVTIGTSLADRLLYLPSVGFCLLAGGLIAAVAHYVSSLKKSEYGQYSGLTMAAVLIIPGSLKTIDRNNDWESVRTLYYQDIQTSPNSSKMNVYYGLERVQEALEQSGTPLRNEYLQDALNHFTRASEITPESHDAWHQMGLARYRLGRYPEAEEAYQKALALRPADPKLYNNYGVLLSELNRHDEAREQYQTAVNMDTRYTDAHRNLGVTYAMLGRFQEALTWLTKAYELNPSDANVVLFIGLTYENLNQPSEASHWKSMAYAMDPSLQNQ